MNPAWIETEHVIAADGFQVGATVTRPDGNGKCPAVLLTGGSMSHLRDGDLYMEDRCVIPRKAIQNLAHHLAGLGIASIRYAYMLLGGLGSSTKTLFDFNYRRTVAYARRSADHLEWVEKTAIKALAVGLHEERLCERICLACLNNPYVDLFYRQIAQWLQRIIR